MAFSTVKNLLTIAASKEVLIHRQWRRATSETLS